MRDSDSLRTLLERLSDLGNGACVGYDLCMKVCPVLESDVPIFELNAAADDPSRMTDRVQQAVQDCVQCGACTEACPTGAPRDAMMLHLRANMPAPPPAYKNYGRLKGGHGLQPWYLDLAKKAFGIYARKTVDPRVWPHLDKQRFEQKDTLLYFGCYAFSGTGSSTVTLDLAEAMGEDFEVLAGLRTCCGWPQMMAGDLERGEELLRGLDTLIQRAAPKVVVSGCAECVAAVQVLARRNGGAFESISTVEWIRRNRHKLDLEPDDVPITFHDSCHLTRKMSRGESSRALMEGLFDVREMERTGRDGACCGYYGFGVNETKTHLLRRERLDEARATGAGVMAVECVTCLESYEKVHQAGDVEVAELQKLVLDAVRRKQESRS